MREMQPPVRFPLLSAVKRAKAQWQRLFGRLRRAVLTGHQRQLRVRETLAIGDKRQLLIVQCGERQLLIGAAGNSLTMLAELPHPERPEGDAA